MNPVRHATAAIQLFEREIAEGNVKLSEVLDLVLTDAESLDELELCPACSRFPIRPNNHHRISGLCEVCIRERMNDAIRETLAHVDALRENNVAKQQLARARDAAGIPRPRGGGKTAQLVSDEVRHSDR